MSVFFVRNNFNLLYVCKDIYNNLKNIVFFKKLLVLTQFVIILLFYMLVKSKYESH